MTWYYQSNICPTFVAKHKNDAPFFHFCIPGLVSTFESTLFIFVDTLDFVNNDIRQISVLLLEFVKGLNKFSTAKGKSLNTCLAMLGFWTLLLSLSVCHRWTLRVTQRVTDSLITTLSKCCPYHLRHIKPWNVFPVSQCLPWNRAVTH